MYIKSHFTQVEQSQHHVKYYIKIHVYKGRKITKPYQNLHRFGCVSYKNVLFTKYKLSKYFLLIKVYVQDIKIINLFQ